MDKEEKYEFGPFEIDETERQLLREGQRILLPSKAFDTLLLLVKRHGHLIEKSELIETIWPDAFVEEGNLAVVISMLRKALGEEGHEHKYIQTVPKHGYRFVADVHQRLSPKLDSPLLVAPPFKLSDVPRMPKLSFVFSLGALGLIAVAISVIIILPLKVKRVPTEIHSVAVLPFRSMKADPAYNYLKLGLADAIITKLASTGQIVVRPTSAIQRYGDTPTDPLLIGREQKVDAILSGYIEIFPE